MNNKCYLYLLCPMLAITTLSTSAMAYKIQTGEDSSLSIDYLLQAQAQFAKEKTNEGRDWSKDFFIRRSRIILAGEITKRFGFFMDTEQANWGKDGDWNTSFFIQDAFMTFTLHHAAIIDAGMIILPFTRHGYQGASGLNGLDYHSALIKYPKPSHKIFRDVGVQFRGYVLDKALQYRAGVFNGAEGVLQRLDDTDPTSAPVLKANEKDVPRFAGHVRYNLLGREPDFFGKGIYFTQNPILSIGAGVDIAPNAALKQKAILSNDKTSVITPGEVGHYAAFAGDVFLDYPLFRASELVFQSAFLYYHFGKDVPDTGWGILSELGYRWKWLEPVASADYFNSSTSGNDYLGIHTGFNFWWKMHIANIKADVAFEKRGVLSDAKTEITCTLQSQLYF